MKQQLNEIKRMQQLAGIIKENEEYGPEFINPNSSKATILTDVYYIGDNAEGDLRSLRGSSIPSYKLQGYTLEDIENEGDGMLYIKKGEEGWYDEEKGVFESKDENSTVAVSKEYIDFNK